MTGGGPPGPTSGAARIQRGHPPKVSTADVSLRLLAQERLWTPSEVARYLGVPVRTLYAWRYRGEGPPGLRVGKHLRYRRTEIDAWLGSQSR